MAFLHAVMEKGAGVLGGAVSTLGSDGPSRTAALSGIFNKEWSPAARIGAGIVGVALMGTGAGAAVRSLRILSSVLCASGIVCMGRSGSGAPLSKWLSFASGKEGTSVSGEAALKARRTPEKVGRSRASGAKKGNRATER